MALRTYSTSTGTATTRHQLLFFHSARLPAQEAAPALPPAALVGAIWMVGHPSPHALLTIFLAPRLPLVPS
eukprot:scaffold89707_cov45-Phaeocystis_antarctica.AAC.1